MAYTDTCVFIKDTSVAAWLNPNIKLTGPLSGAYKADPPPNVNALAVNVHLQGDCQLEDPEDPIKVEVWVSPPNAAPASVAQYTRIANGSLTGAALADLIANGSKERAFNWLINPADPNQQPGHHCLRARVFPSSNTPPTQFDMNDQHEGQHNICIVPCGSPCGLVFLIWTIWEDVEPMTLRAIVDLRPDEVLIKALQPALPPDFKEFLFENPPRFEIDPGDGEFWKIRDNNDQSPDGTYGGQPFPNVEIDFLLFPGKPVAVRFLTDLEKIDPGYGFIFHFTHLDREQQIQGGLTAIAMRAPRASRPRRAPKA
jgi:hypothetical protein